MCIFILPKAQDPNSVGKRTFCLCHWVTRRAHFVTFHSLIEINRNEFEFLFFVFCFKYYFMVTWLG